MVCVWFWQDPRRVKTGHIARMWPGGCVKSKLTFYFELLGSEVSCEHGGGSHRERKHILYPSVGEGQLDLASEQLLGTSF